MSCKCRFEVPTDWIVHDDRQEEEKTARDRKEEAGTMRKSLAPVSANSMNSRASLAPGRASIAPGKMGGGRTTLSGRNSSFGGRQSMAPGGR